MHFKCNPKENRHQYHISIGDFLNKTIKSTFDILYNVFPKFDDDIEQKTLSPLSCIRELESKWVIEFDLPLVKKEDISVSINSENTIAIEAKLVAPYCDPKIERCEFEYFKKSITLPGKINEKNITANFSNGRLIITVPKIFSGNKIPIQ
ncbi:MAG: Hsp20/alpha crystallin family protein [Nitrosopumilales archaeon]|nr:Hsp20/alpha crystallin family protein [Nitrosopumilales archaeon]